MLCSIFAEIFTIRLDRLGEGTKIKLIYKMKHSRLLSLTVFNGKFLSWFCFLVYVERRVEYKKEREK